MHQLLLAKLVKVTLGIFV